MRSHAASSALAETSTGFVENGLLLLDRSIQKQPRLVCRSCAQLRDVQARAVGCLGDNLRGVIGEDRAFRSREVILGQLGDGVKKLRAGAVIKQPGGQAFGPCSQSFADGCGDVSSNCRATAGEAAEVMFSLDARTWTTIVFLRGFNPACRLYALNVLIGFRKLPPCFGREKVTVGGANVARGRNTGSAAQDHLPTHKFAVVLAQRAVERMKAGIAEIRTTGPHPTITPQRGALVLEQVLRKPASGVPRPEDCPQRAGPAAAATSHSNSVGSRNPAQRA